MTMKAWWEADPEERFWVEITDRTDLGANLHSPQTADNGKPTPGYESMKFVKPGDVVLHYWKPQAGQDPIFIGHSTVAGEPYDAKIYWKAHGKTALGKAATTRPAYKVPLTDFADLPTPVSLTDLRAHEATVHAILDGLEAKYGKPTYFPFRFSAHEPMRGMQYYLTKLPKALADLVFELGEGAPPPPANAASRAPAPSASASAAGGGYQTNTRVKDATEAQAMQQAAAFLEGLGYAVTDTSANHPWDLEAREGDEVLRVEVKGSTVTRSTVDVTSGEVDAAWDMAVPSALVVVDQIPFTDDGTTVLTKPGRLRIEWDWSPDPDRLQATSYRYLLPVLDEP